MRVGLIDVEKHGLRGPKLRLGGGAWVQGNSFREQAKLGCYVDKSIPVNLGKDNGYRFIGWQKGRSKYVESGNL